MMKSKPTILVAKNRKYTLALGDNEPLSFVFSLIRGTAVQGNGPNSGAGNVLKNIFAKASAQQNERFPGIYFHEPL